MINDPQIYIVVVTVIIAFFVGYKVVSRVVGWFFRTQLPPMDYKQSFRDDEATSFKRSMGSGAYEPNNSAVKDGRYYRNVLGLHDGFSRDDLHARYKELASQYHPDKVHSLGPKLRDVAESEMKEIHEAVEFFLKRYGNA